MLQQFDYVLVSLNHVILKFISVLKELNVAHIFGTKSAVDVEVQHVSLVLGLLMLPCISAIANSSEVTRLASHPTEGKKISPPARHDDIVKADHTVMFELQVSPHILQHLEIISLRWGTQFATEGVVQMILQDMFLLSSATCDNIKATEVTGAGHLIG